MKLSETKSGENWLKKFNPSEIDVAKNLLDNLILVSNQKLKEGLGKLLSTLPRINRKIPLSAIYVPIEPPIKKGRHPKGSKYPAYKQAFFDQNGKAISLDPRNVGSEGELLNFLRNTYKNNTHYFIWPDLSILKDKKLAVRRIIFIDDCVGSGDRVVKFFRWFFENKSLKSLYSMKKIEFYVLSYAMTSLGEKKIKANKRIKNCISCIELTKGRFFWSKKQYNEYEAFCKSNFQGKTKSFYVNNGIGYNDSFSMIAFEHGIPNNVPHILRIIKLKESDFNRNFIGNIANFDETACQDLRKKIKSGFFQENSSLILRFLSFLKDCRTPNGVLRKKMANDYLEIFRNDFLELVNKCVKMDLIDQDLYLTKNALKIFRDQTVRRNKDIEISNEFYYY